MGLFNKLKNILFEEEEIEEEIVENHPHSRRLIKQDDDTEMMELPKITKETKKESHEKEYSKLDEYNFEDETDKELFKSERTFDFPAFDEDEFEDLLPKKEEIVKKTEKKEEKDFIQEKYKKELQPPKRRNDYTSVRVEVPKVVDKNSFKPSPVISPVYGILDKNYRKEDVITRDEKLASEKVKLDVDSVRKKAFGTLEENLDVTVTEPTVTFYEDVNDKIEQMEDLEENEVIETVEEENLDNLLEDTVDVEIDVTKEMEVPSRSEKKQIEEDEEEDIIEEQDDEVEEIEEKITDDKEENDLFELIDSMYENKEEE